MITHFPEFYPDELLYSLLARYYVQSGYISLSYAIDDLYVHKYTTPDIEFINELKQDAVEAVTRQMPMEQVIEKHTMFPSYGRFMTKQRKQQAFQELVSMHGNFNNLLALPKNQRGTKRVLRYCPVCAKSDREMYGESYWHRSHQLQGIDCCPEHGCYLENSAVSMGRKESPSLTSAEAIVPYLIEPAPYNNQQGMKLARYMMDVFQAPMDIETDVAVGEFLHFNINSEKYRSATGARTEIGILYQDMRKASGM